VEALAPLIASIRTQELTAVKSRIKVQNPNEKDLDGDTALFEAAEPLDYVAADGGCFLVPSIDQSIRQFELDVSEDMPKIEPRAY